jgi:hypothetical protein
MLGIYKHYKNKHCYQLLAYAKHTETNEALVIYQALYDEKLIWARPETMFFEKILYEGKEIQRFEWISE